VTTPLTLSRQALSQRVTCGAHSVPLLRLPRYRKSAVHRAEHRDQGCHGQRRHQPSRPAVPRTGTPVTGADGQLRCLRRGNDPARLPAAGPEAPDKARSGNAL
jgi:hypothetical protein